MKENMDKNKKYTRRETIKYAGKIGLGAALWGTAGNFLGQGYQAIRPYFKKVKTSIDTTEKGAKNTKEFVWDTPKKFYKNIWDKYFAKKPKKTPLSKLQKNEKNVSRREFLEPILKYFHKNPVEAGTATGVAYGGGKKALSGYKKYESNKTTAELKEKSEIQENEINKLKNKVNTLEKIVSKENIIIALGIGGIVLSIFKMKTTLIGFAISNSFLNQINFLPAILFILSIILIAIGISKKIK